ncbi:aminopeptidase N [Labedaea rhizosphaerae]|uniref:Aminopeptidase N n=1 Tax=Labedaea rhizosphaerae TaxID=598644 RepID=A0A4R6RWA2_LABRH|nr:aminopeptidase N [Labedaea rhizosphaerae]TDP91074.1 aminopeptidase N [Labedaea rhizosphaerae]
MAGNLTRDEARARSRSITVDTVSVTLDLTTGPTRFASTTELRFRCTEPGTGTFVDLAGAVVHEVTLNGVTLDPGAYDQARGRFALSGLAAENELRVVADCAYSRTGQGLHRFVDPEDGKVYLHTQMATADAHRVFACFDQPDLKSPFEFTVTAPADWIVVSNSAEDSCVPVGDARRWHFPPTPPISTYLTAAVAGHYHAALDEYRGKDGQVIPLGVFCRASLAEHLDAEEIFDVTKRGFDFFQQAFGSDYPFGKYDQPFVPEFNLGAMENPGCVTFKDEYVFRSRVTDADHQRRASTILHEMAHMWFGDLVTMRWWDDLWLNESFATYAAGLAQTSCTRWTGAWADFAHASKARAARQDQLPTTHPIAADIPDIRSMEVNFDAITYSKGASVLKQLVAAIGLEEFLAGLRRYFAKHAWGNTTLDDLLTALAEETGRDLRSWSDQWLRTSGPNTLRAEFAVDDAGRFSSFAVVQTAPEDHPTLRTHRIAIGLYDESMSRVRRVELDVAGPRTEVAELIGAQRPALVLLNDDDLTYAKIRLDPESLRAMRAGIARFTDPVAQAVCWMIAWDLTRDGELPARDYAALVLAGVESVSSLLIVRTLLAQACTAVQEYTSPAEREEAAKELGSGLSALLAAAPAGSDTQLAYAQALAAAAQAPQHLDQLAAILDGTDVPDGLVVDAALRWSLLRRLAVHGRAGAADIEAELTRDATASGGRSAVAAHAAIGTPEAKTQAWQRMASGELTNAELRSALEGFTEPAHAPLRTPFTEPYFRTLASVVDIWPTELTQTFAAGAYPNTTDHEDTLAHTERYLAEADPPAWLRRLVLEGQDELRRAARAQQASRA